MRGWYLQIGEPSFPPQLHENARFEWVWEIWGQKWGAPNFQIQRPADTSPHFQVLLLTKMFVLTIWTILVQCTFQQYQDHSLKKLGQVSHVMMHSVCLRSRSTEAKPVHVKSKHMHTTHSLMAALSKLLQRDTERVGGGCRTP